MTLLKSIVAGLVLANVGYFLWDRGIATAPGAGAPTAGAPEAVPATPSLKLASEVPGVAAPGVAAPGVAAPGVAATAQPNLPTPAASADGPADSSMDEGAAQTGAAQTGAAQAVAAPAAGVRCVSLGAFRDVSEAARVAGNLRSRGYDPRQRVAEGEVWAGVWVYLPLPPAPAAAAQMLNKLKAGGIDDALEMPGPNDTSVISLGLFSEQKRAQARVAQAQALALNPAVADRRRNGNVYWIDIDLKPAEVLNFADLQGDSSHIFRLEEKACPAASSQR